MLNLKERMIIQGIHWLICEDEFLKVLSRLLLRMEPCLILHDNVNYRKKLPQIVTQMKNPREYETTDNCLQVKLKKNVSHLKDALHISMDPLWVGNVLSQSLRS